LKPASEDDPSTVQHLACANILAVTVFNRTVLVEEDDARQVKQKIMDKPEIERFRCR
jgi:hypothetical protein